MMKKVATTLAALFLSIHLWGGTVVSAAPASASSNKPPLPKEWSIPKKEGDRVPDVDFMTRTRVVQDDGDVDFDWKVRTSQDYFKGKRVVLFALPGAFTPTCSSTHLPGYQDKYEELKALGIDEVYCTWEKYKVIAQESKEGRTTIPSSIQESFTQVSHCIVFGLFCSCFNITTGLSVNDAFVMRKWGIDLGLEEDKTVGSLGFTKVKLIPDGAATFTRAMGMSTMWDVERGFGERSWRYSMVVNDGVIEKIFIEEPRMQNSEADPFEVSDVYTMMDYLKLSFKDEL